ncbi:LuxR C-terminal-related transcriptional regulator [Streptomyces sp. V1I1]|uniref:LuxR C-terminal-related transcriptional regulator n=1 Tax=Streptomyces sp. V1I1 TaxID=3042272 RepID=UPI00358F2AA2
MRVPVPEFRLHLRPQVARPPTGTRCAAVGRRSRRGSGRRRRGEGDRRLALIDIQMPVVDGIEATRRIAADPALAQVHVVILTNYDFDEYVFNALRAGAAGFLVKDIVPEDLLHAVRVAARGDALLAPSITRKLINRYVTQPLHTGADAGLEELTNREREAVVLVAEGLSNDQIADHMVISPLTAKTHINRAMAKLHARDRAQLVVLAYESGLVAPRNR